MIFMGCFIPTKTNRDIIKNIRISGSVAGSNFQNSLINGILENGEEDFVCVNCLPVGTFPKHYKKLYLNKEINIVDGCKWSIELPSCNLPIIKQYQRYRQTLKLLRKEKEKQKILIYSPLPFYLKALSKLKVKHDITLIVTDLPQYYNLSQGKTSLLKRKYENMMIKYLNIVDRFVLLTEDMKYPLNVGERPYIVVEGLVDTNDVCFNLKNKQRSGGKIRSILYSGTLHYQFGIKNLLDAFKKIDNDNYRLIICGSGEAEEEIKHLAKQDKRIVFKGYMTKDDLLKEQQSATVLVNPRQNIGDYVKYSFPSKTMEYMLSGIPVVMYKLDGIPDEYDKYLNYVEDNSVDALKNKLIQVCELSFEEREKMCKLARNFVIKHKNAKTQAKKIIEFMED